MQEIGNDGLAEVVKEQVLRNSSGRCLCEYTAHDHPLPCGKPLGMDYYWYYIDLRVKILSESTVMVECPKCHSKILSSERKST
jgi:DNA-directed RNA polymerase subunit RPC12/RpoP